MKKLFYKRIENAKIFKNLLLIQGASIILAVIIFCGLCLEKIPDTPYYSASKEMKKGDSYNCSPFASVEVTVEDINSDGESCLISIEDLKNQKEQAEWVKKGESVSFMTDSTKIYIEGIEKDSVSVILQYGKGGSKYRIRGPWRYLE
jgi:hypothetical protein